MLTGFPPPAQLHTGACFAGMGIDFGSGLALLPFTGAHYCGRDGLRRVGLLRPGIDPVNVGPGERLAAFVQG